MLRSAVKQFADWHTVWSPPMTMAINVSAYELFGGNLADRVSRALEENDIEAHFIELEFDDGLLSGPDIAKLGSALGQLDALGIRIAIDDFGTGAGSLMQLRMLPISTLKIDSSLVHGIGTDAEDDALIRAIASLGLSPKLRVLAEGVESDAQLSFLKEAGCNFVQSYYFGLAVPAELMTARLEEQEHAALAAV